MMELSTIERKINVLMAMQDDMRSDLLEIYQGWDQGPNEENGDDGYVDRLLQFLMAQKEQWVRVESMTRQIKNVMQLMK